MCLCSERGPPHLNTFTAHHSVAMLCCSLAFIYLIHWFSFIYFPHSDCYIWHTHTHTHTWEENSSSVFVNVTVTLLIIWGTALSKPATSDTHFCFYHGGSFQWLLYAFTLNWWYLLFQNSVHLYFLIKTSRIRLDSLTLINLHLHVWMYSMVSDGALGSNPLNPLKSSPRWSAGLGMLALKEVWVAKPA